MFDWSVIYFKKVVVAPIALQGAGFTAFMFTMAGGRFVADWFAHRFGLKRTLQVSGLLTATGLLVAADFSLLLFGYDRVFYWLARGYRQWCQWFIALPADQKQCRRV